MNQKNFTFTVINSNGETINIDGCTDIPKMKLLLQDAKTLQIGDVSSKFAHVTGYDTVKAFLKAASDTFRHQVYTIKGNKHYYSWKDLSTGYVFAAGVVYNPDEEYPWGRIDLVAGIEKVVFKVAHRKAGGGFEVGPAIPESQQWRHNHVRFITNPNFVGAKVDMYPGLTAYFATILCQWVNEDDAEALAQRNLHMQAAGEKAGMRSELAAPYKDAKLVKNVTFNKLPILFNNFDGGTVDLWTLPKGFYPTAFNGQELIGTSYGIDWDPTEGVMREADQASLIARGKNAKFSLIVR